MTDHDNIIIHMALREAGKIIGEYLGPGPRDAERTINRLIAVLDTQGTRGCIRAGRQAGRLSEISGRLGRPDD